MLAGEGEGRNPLEKESANVEVFYNTSYFGFASFSFFLFFSQAPALEPWTCDPCILKPNAASQQAGTRTSTSLCFVT
ncbi:hypothetical protein E1A91_D02G241500v1 [Gossypium mustelinum]|uniref:Uncharacterized protein n=1 Tax=Gossypium mustelinum TaxID=34275 RepID=A0A5D2W014_GOSMU|nr:hypothetical protein E1A91_D02G241500v1 [Gossypium mustelinum]